MSETVLHHVLWGQNPPHSETDLELMQEHLLRGDTVHALVCRAELPTCDVNPEHSVRGCLTCIGGRRRGFDLLQRGPGRLEVHAALRLEASDRAALAAVPRRFPDLAALEGFTFGELDAGLAALSSVVSTLRDPAPSVELHADLIEHYLLGACSTYLSALRWVAALRPTRAYVYNGRFAMQRAFLRACVASRVPCFVHERGSTLAKYDLCQDVMPLDIRHIERQIRAAWAAAGPAEAGAIGRRFYEDLARGRSYNWIPYVEAQDPRLLPHHWPEGRRKVAIFLSSEDEFVAIGRDWRNPVYRGQAEGLAALLEDLRRDDVHVYVRCHPNSAKSRDRALLRLLERGDHGNATIIRPESPVSTYALLRAADVVVTFGSTVGIEATFWRRPSVLLGMSLYRCLDGTYNPATHDDALRLLRDPALAPRPLEAALMYGHYIATFGNDFKHFEPTGISKGRFRGHPTEPVPNVLTAAAGSLAPRFGSFRSARRGVRKVLRSVTAAWLRRP